jgi:hypothetical protein
VVLTAGPFLRLGEKIEATPLASGGAAGALAGQAAARPVSPP